MSAHSFRQPVLRQIRGGVIANEFCEEHQTSPLRPWLDPKNWPQVLLNLGRSITIERLVSDFKDAQEKGEGRKSASGLRSTSMSKSGLPPTTIAGAAPITGFRQSLMA